MEKIDVAPREFNGPTEKKRKGLLIVYTGNGKGKSTAAFGAVFRCLGRGFKAGIVQFIKGKWVSGEIKSLEKFPSQVDYWSEGEGFTWETKNLDKDILIAKKGWSQCLKLLQEKKHDVLLFDELLYVLKYQFLTLEDVLEGIKLKAPDVHLILTGRDAPAKIIELADLVTEMKEVKHPFQQGILAQPGIDY